MNEKRYIQIGGSPKKAVAGDYDLDVPAIIKEAWNLTRTNKQPMMIAVFTVMAISMAILLLLAQAMGGVELIFSDQQRLFAVNMVLTTLISPLIAGLEMMGISFAIGMKSKPNMVFAFLKKSAFIALLSIIVSCLTSLGTQLFLLPGIYLAVALSLSAPLVVEKNLSPNQALILSIKATRFKWFKLLQVYLFVLAITLPAIFLVAMLAQNVGALAAIIAAAFALTWIAPFFYFVKGILYRQIFGVRMQVLDDNADGPGEGYFSA
ncbi:hypothetical protein [Thalassotalea mangrovi]|uniref:Glycerophosphoryl diester phosphodiesterase membrane domain-containing protein n=1 Tax=Thalassotalea mangrovi TaxID=2572245 RepID=A0A4U1B7G0_9GAMM|nr:hypothetical protein [Thalassotalea mangrovi]TKB45841.1 hypothetical protein E8M12_06235 [Thalassotalea mangrovi]